MPKSQAFSIRWTFDPPICGGILLRFETIVTY